MNEHVKPQPGDIVVMGNARVDSQHKLFPLGGSRGVVIADVPESGVCIVHWDSHWNEDKSKVVPYEYLHVQPHTRTCKAACNTPWWHIWNPCSKFGWTLYVAFGMSVPYIAERLVKIF